MRREFPRGALAAAPGYTELVVVHAVRAWPFPYAECRTGAGELVPIPVSRLTRIRWNFEDPT
ncbi:hypothetical protein IU500_07080 [Nocardia terpenica]|uniref:Uncharacterized protein n=1 Tax=Nocardia terpenica TaxID=455432 RepID=A0A164K1S0_9NOCA|nr:hypothetical protein [Nocardia terpenica]KZM70940.1 hypothetical protein AWN90_41180 [Nocardia terpenica]MBF6060540.1 hypothetical protein [Nocardia terpenica]MBF6103800.1 hypothetical protein [Nocardia terpenica]MBF6111826.1 hypothetical protein [Nocardia terpenica]MBF6118021.1 hypothetical protein [Nocardia terpenica]